MTTTENWKSFIEAQLEVWDTARDNYAALQRVRTKQILVDGLPYRVQFNPARIVSSGAKVDKQSISQRRCFLCKDNLPAVQRGVDFRGRYTLLVNPFPIFPLHLTIPVNGHLPQTIRGRMGDMLDLAESLPDFTVFYNGPCCGASAPDHAHFQAGSRGFLPVESYWRQQVRPVCELGSGRLYSMSGGPGKALVIESGFREEIVGIFERICSVLPVKAGEEEPMLNVLALYEAGGWVVFVFPRSKHRPSCYEASGDARLLCSPASVDMGGVFITPLEQDFEKMDECIIKQILLEVSLSQEAFGELIAGLQTNQ